MPIDADNDANVSSQAQAEQQSDDKKVVEKPHDQGFTFRVNQYKNNENSENKESDDNGEKSSQREGNREKSTNAYNINSSSNINNSSSQEIDAEHIEDIKNLQTPELRENVERVREGDVDEYLKNQVKEENSNIRNDTIYTEALKYGTQSALYYRSKQVNNFLDKISGQLDEAFAFQPLLMANGKVVPPVIMEGQDSYFQDGDSEYSKVDKTFKIHKQARVINTPLNWRSYVNFNPSKPALPEKMALPLNEEEDKVWEKGVVKGWELGLRQANNIFEQQFTELEVDYIGMVRYHLLETSGIVNNPVTSSTNIGINKNDDTLNIGETRFEITRLPDFNSNSKTWEALPKMKNFIDIDDI